ncbi:MAG: thermonuclease family protein [Thermoleophilia bacterium]
MKRIPVVVAAVPEGDTVELQDGRVVRLAQVDAPAAVAGECYGVRARQALRALLPKGTRVRLESDPALDPVDAEGRLVRYVRVQGENVNLLLVRAGAVSVWFAGGDRGRYADDLLGEAKAARAARIGLWRECPGTRLDPKRPALTIAPTGRR